MQNYTHKEWKEEFENLKICPIYGYIKGDYKNTIFTINNRTVGVIKYYGGCFYPYLHYLYSTEVYEKFSCLFISEMDISEYIVKPKFKKK